MTVGRLDYSHNGCTIRIPEVLGWGQIFMEKIYGSYVVIKIEHQLDGT